METRLLWLGCLCLAFSSIAVAATGVPDWVRNTAEEKLPPYPPETKAVVLLLDAVYTVNPDGKAEKHVRGVVKILRPQGRSYGEAMVPYNSDEKVNYFHVWSIGPDRHEYELKDKDQSE